MATKEEIKKANKLRGILYDLALFKVTCNCASCKRKVSEQVIKTLMEMKDLGI